MSSPRLHRTVKGRVLYAIGVAFILCYFYFISESKNEGDSACPAERDTLRRQLQVLIEYKSRMEKSLAEERGAHLQAKSFHDEDKERLDALKQHFNILQTQFNDLSEECNKIKDLNQANTHSLEKFKEKYLQEKVSRDTLQHQLDEKCNGREELSRRVASLEKENHMLKSNTNREHFPDPVLHTLRMSQSNNLELKNISKQTVLSEGIYIVNITNKMNRQNQKDKSKVIVAQENADLPVLKNPYENYNANDNLKKVDKSTSKITPKIKASTKSGVHNNIPAGVVPVMQAENYISPKVAADKPDRKAFVESPKDPMNAEMDNKVDNNADLNVKFNRYKAKIESDLDVRNHVNMEAAIAEIQNEKVSPEMAHNKEDNGGDIQLENNGPVPADDKIGENEKVDMEMPVEEPDNDFHDLNNSHDLFEHDGARNAVDEDDDDAEYMAPQRDI